MKELKKYSKLLIEYSIIKDELLEYTDEFHDSMLYDIQGFNGAEQLQIDFLPELEAQVKAFRLILKGYKAINYTFS